ncbi:PepSY domain-containing protein [Saccharobesus litoralis]|uniref:PepSY domain-containing protein n=1 Tax=Saccharobesus litoralis TaxID=2172099 RepID=A0A2S0VPM3_9ALTE|nr:PepSY-associated TM helix domain-containing protein [Saccharobesus litoralis]AWB66143.1 PepSY domain-containing protein [Saccharobesus litoralis]
MKGRFRQSMNWLHTWGGFVLGWLLYFIFVTGALGYFEDEIDRWLKPEMVVVKTDLNQQQTLANVEAHLAAHAQQSPSWYISYPTERSPFLNATWLQLADKENNIEKAWVTKNIDPSSGAMVQARDTAGGRTLYRLHYNLHYIPHELAWWLTSFAALVMFIGLITGIIIHKKIFIELFTFRANKGLRAWLDIHNLFSVLPLPFHLMITYSGLVLLMTVTMTNVIKAGYADDDKAGLRFFNQAFADSYLRQPSDILPEQLSLQSVLHDAQLRYPQQKVSYIGSLARHSDKQHYEVWFDKYEGIELAAALTYRIEQDQVVIDVANGKQGVAAKIYDWFEHLHEGLFADIYLRWLYFLSGLMGAGMIATGMIIWALKRREKPTGNQPIKLGVIERLNAGIILGLPIAVGVFFASNRLLPIDMLGRELWEMHCLFIALGCCIVFCLLRCASRVWLDSLIIGASLFICLPLVNAMTTGQHLIWSWQQQDWLMLGGDLTMLGTGGVFALSAVILKRRSTRQNQQPARINSTIGQVEVMK